MLVARTFGKRWKIQLVPACMTLSPSIRLTWKPTWWVDCTFWARCLKQLIRLRLWLSFSAWSMLRKHYYCSMGSPNICPRWCDGQPVQKLSINTYGMKMENWYGRWILVQKPGKTLLIPAAPYYQDLFVSILVLSIADEFLNGFIVPSCRKGKSSIVLSKNTTTYLNFFVFSKTLMEASALRVEAQLFVCACEWTWWSFFFPYHDIYFQHSRL